MLDNDLQCTARLKVTTERCLILVSKNIVVWSFMSKKNLILSSRLLCKDILKRCPRNPLVVLRIRIIIYHLSEIYDVVKRYTVDLDSFHCSILYTEFKGWFLTRWTAIFSGSCSNFEWLADIRTCFHIENIFQWKLADSRIKIWCIHHRV